MKCRYKKPSSGISLVTAFVKKPSVSPATRGAEYHKMKDETRMEKIKARATSVQLHLTFR
jgi:hypothetical protein